MLQNTTTGPLSWLSVVPLGNQDPLLGQWDCCEDDNCVTSPRLPAAGLSCPGGQCVASPVLCCVSLSMLCVHPSLRTPLYWSCRPLHLATHCTLPDPRHCKHNTSTGAVSSAPGVDPRHVNIGWQLDIRDVKYKAHSSARFAAIPHSTGIPFCQYLHWDKI